MKILMTQLQNQDPTQPMEDKEFIAQMAQFSSVEQLMNISTQMTAMSQSLGSVSGLIGKDVTLIDTETKLPKTGNVESIVVNKGVQYAVVGTERIALTDITQIQNAASKVETVSDKTQDGAGESGGQYERQVDYRTTVSLKCTSSGSTATAGSKEYGQNRSFI